MIKKKTVKPRTNKYDYYSRLVNPDYWVNPPDFRPFWHKLSDWIPMIFYFLGVALVVAQVLSYL